MITFILEHPEKIASYLNHQERLWEELQEKHPLPPDLVQRFVRARTASKTCVKIRFQADANLDPDIGLGLQRRDPSLDYRRALGIMLFKSPVP